MTKNKFSITFTEYDEEDNVTNEDTKIYYNLTPDEGKYFINKSTGEKFITSEGIGAILEISEEFLENIEEVDIETSNNSVNK